MTKSELDAVFAEEKAEAKTEKKIEKPEPKKEEEDVGHPPFIKLLAEASEKEPAEIALLVEAKMEELEGYVTAEGATMLVARALGFDTDKIFPKELIKDAASKGLPKQEEATPEEETQTLGEVFEEEAAAPKAVTVTPEEFDYSEDTERDKEIYTIYGSKGEGKTTLAFSFPGKIACLSFDLKSIAVKQRMYEGDERIHVYNAVRYMDASSSDNYLASNETTFRYILGLLNKVAEIKPNWVVIDGLEELQRICEMTMRFRNDLQPFQGIANRNLWKERRIYLRQVHKKACEVAKKGVIYTTYVREKEIVEQGITKTKKDIPAWIDMIKEETDTLIKVFSRRVEDKLSFFGFIETSKTIIPTGLEFDMTNVGMKPAFKAAKEAKA